MVGGAFAQSGRTPVQTKTPPTLTNSDLIDPNPIDYYSVGEVKGNIAPAKAILLPKPSFTEFARDMGADGKVRVDIVIASDGTVSSAEPVSGDPALFEPAKRAAMGSRFLPVQTSTPGYLIYDFQVRKANWFVIGFDLSSVVFMRPGIIRTSIPIEWTEEREVARQLCGLHRNYLKNRIAPVLNDIRTSSGGTSTKTEIRGTIQIVPINEDYARLAGELKSRIGQRLAADPAGLRFFELAGALHSAIRAMRDPSKMQYAYNLIEPYSEDPLLPEPVLKRLRAISDQQLKLTPKDFVDRLTDLVILARSL